MRADKPTEVTFVGDFKLEEFKSETDAAGNSVPPAGSGPHTAVLVASNPYEFSLDADCSGKPYQMVRMVFEHALWARISPGYLAQNTAF